MALTGTDRGTGTNQTAATSFNLTAGSNLTAGALAVLCIAADNTSSGGTTNDTTGCTDSLGNTWVARQKGICDNGAASQGVQSTIFTTNQSAGAITTSTTITVSFGSSPTAKTWALMEITAGSGKQALYLAGGVATQQTNTTAPTVTTGTIAVDDLVVALVALECGVTQTLTADADTTNGTWSTPQYAEIGSTVAGSAIGSQRKLQTTTASTQTFNPTLALACDLICSWISVREVTPKKLALGGVG